MNEKNKKGVCVLTVLTNIFQSVRGSDNIFSTLFNRFADPAFEITEIANERARESGLPGFIDGPGDAMKHIAGAAMMGMHYTAPVAFAMLQDRELEQIRQNSGSNPSMDLYNNNIGLAIGRYVSEHGGTREDAIRLSQELVEKALEDGDLRDWDVESEGIITAPGNPRVSLQMNEGTPPLEIKLPAFAAYPDGQQVQENDQINLGAAVRHAMPFV